MTAPQPQLEALVIDAAMADPVCLAILERTPWVALTEWCRDGVEVGISPVTLDVDGPPLVGGDPWNGSPCPGHVAWGRHPDLGRCDG